MLPYKILIVVLLLLLLPVQSQTQTETNIQNQTLLENTVTPSENATVEPIPVESIIPTPVQAQLLVVTEPAPASENVDATIEINLNNLSEEMKQKMLDEERIRSALHENSDATLRELANLTASQQIEFERRLAEESKIAYERVKKQMEERQKKQKEDMQRLVKQNKLTKTQMVRAQELEKYKLLDAKYNSFAIQGKTDSRAFNDYMFDLQSNTEQDFSITIPHSQDIVFYSHTYINKDGVYMKSDDVDSQIPLQIIVYQNKTKIIEQRQFYFIDFGAFTGKDKSTYTLKFINRDSKERLIALSILAVIEETHINKALTSDSIISYGIRAQKFLQTITRRFEELYKKLMIEKSNERQLNSGIEKYYIYTICQMVFVGLLCLLQVHFLQKLLGNSSIV